MVLNISPLNRSSYSSITSSIISPARRAPPAPACFSRRSLVSYRATAPTYGVVTPLPKNRTPTPLASFPFHFQTGYALCPKRPSRPFPPPFVSNPSTSFSDPLTTHFRSQDKRPSVRGELIRGLTNGDDAILVSENYLGVNDGVGAWATKPQGHAALWSRLILHFWALEVERNVNEYSPPDVVSYLQRAYELTVEATTTPNEWLGTTTSTTAVLHYTTNSGAPAPMLHVTTLGDCQLLVIRPSEQRVVFKTEGQWHWFDCPMQLGTNSIDTPKENAQSTQVELQEKDLVVAVSDGVVDNLWEHEVMKVVLDSLEEWDSGKKKDADMFADQPADGNGGVVYAARNLLQAAKAIAQDPFAESPYMEKAIDEGLTIEGGKMDDISVVIGRCMKRNQ
ncbi:hypothetical protein RJZ56_005936 [Blastomyces dermatitidis]|uniref:Protein phosphatase n=3 Tax=Blastomyces TaxID=229219 RepID=A0A179UM94_BLAGS|nr:uncharacterized protein BDBG_04524 [Blastomyces gilchristii SLH14081]XP_045274011.1 uncharacterized protein BDCG_01586 [Blastomyces dermatitidis ER-3]EGE79141.1 rRNA-processing protein UTP23 [Blastomyces dermatitidis ATCC 18188]EQL29287.1 hypothetical protein BDFG_08090 [Blastomyces dermatitidis ATCC 26199]EEQ86466.2 hypothetical protein BDCG_01586 [Blastomyces dermatitidis ER-3]OAT08933.1 hypothetical protein BDBG_04524 [Blastomyces gilchristii SLH14081]